jgi:streptogramin lyase
LWPNPYGKDDTVWFDEFTAAGKIYRLDAKTHEIKSYQPTTAGSPRRLQVASDGTIRFNEFRVGKIARFDPKTETFREYSVLSARPTPDRIGIDKKSDVWYSSEYLDVTAA